MPHFEIKTPLPVNANRLSKELLTMKGVNHELGPWLKMSAPNSWHDKPLSEWPISQALFTSKILLFGLFPIDLHRFQFNTVSESGFQESSTSFVNKIWEHERRIEHTEFGSVVKDTVYYGSRLGFMGYVFKPLYQFVFAHRHKRLKLRYGD